LDDALKLFAGLHCYLAAPLLDSADPRSYMRPVGIQSLQFDRVHDWLFEHLARVYVAFIFDSGFFARQSVQLPM
jgi:hypothetical protein